MTVSGTAARPGDIRKTIVDALWNRVVNDATGVSEPALVRYTGPAPTGRFWLGVLTPESAIRLPGRPGEQDDRNRPRAANNRGRSRELADRFTPAAQGFSFRVEALPFEMEVSASFRLWLALHPTFDEQRRGAGLDTGDDDEEPGDAPLAGGVAPDPPQRLARARMKVPVEDIRFSVTVDRIGERTVGAGEITAAIRQGLAGRPVSALPYRPLKRRGGDRPRGRDVVDEAAWKAWERANLDDPALPEWRAEVDIEVTGPADGPFEVLVMIVNRSPDGEGQFVDRDRTRVFPRWACDPHLYEVRLACMPAARTVPYELEQIPDSYRYDRRVPALGMNGAVEEDGTGFRTAFAAVAETNRVYPRTAANGQTLDTAFTTLKTDPLPALEAMMSAAGRWVDGAWNDLLTGMQQDDGWRPDTLGKAGEDAREARAEVAWVRAGIDLLQNDPDLLEAFKLMNETMERAANGRYTAWHPFQIAFIVGCLAGVRNPAATPDVDILWFSTGGGKTEAYLGLNLVQLFYGRLKGRTGGAQTWARFPLRLLSLQQTQRFADSVLLAELVRRAHPRLRNGEPFAIGYYVGAGNTPNSITLPGSRFYDGWDPFDDRNTRACRVLELCPGCRDPVRPPVVEFDRDAYTMIHKCPNETCPFYGDRLPVYVIDDDIYRWAPSVIVGTVDKLAQLGQQAAFRILLGGAMARCSKHGYAARLDRCAIFGCQEPLRPVPAGFGGIMFEIQDELHLLSESLGALDGNYETLFQAVAAELGIPAIRIIGATATIEGYREQADHLYRRAARRFPIPGPTKAESFWAVERPGEPLRTYVAMLPRGTTMLNAAFYVTQSYWRFIREGLDDTAAFCTNVLGVPAGQAAEVTGLLRDLYEVLVTYGLRKQDLERYAKDVAEDAEICPGAGNYDSITGDVEFWDVRDVLNRLERPPADPAQRIRVLGATSAISHGVDVNRLNVMTVMGMPKQTAEFIQATARVGRQNPAVVFTLVNPMRERDVSHFRYFRKYAEYLDRLVEPVPVNRESLPVLKRVLSGGLMALLLQVDEPRWLFPGGRPPRIRRDRLWDVRGVARAIDEGVITEPGLIERLRRAFAVDPVDPRFADHRRAIEDFVSRNVTTFLLQRGSNRSTRDEMDPPPPRSLRDVEPAIEIMGER